MGNGVISEESLMSKLAGSKKLMNTSNVKKPSKKMDYYGDDDENNNVNYNINENMLYSDPNGLIETPTSNPTRSYPTPTINKINESRLPENIKQAMINNPIVQPDISLSETLDIKLVQKARKLMEQDNPKSTSLKSKQSTQQNNGYNTNNNISEIINAMTPIIENTIRKVLDEKLTQILTASETSSLNENLVLKVGDSIFKGKITGVKTAK